MRRGEVYVARLGSTEGSEQAGTRPIVVVSRDAINASSPVMVVVPCTSYRPGQRLYPSQVLIHAPEGGLEVDSVALAEQVRTVATTWLLGRRGALIPQTLAQIDRALAVTLDLSGPM